MKDNSAMQEIAAHLEATFFTAIQPRVVDAAKRRLIDIVGCMIGGVNAPGNAELREVATGWGGGAGRASVVATSLRMAAHDAAMVNAIMARSYDFGVLTPYIGERPIWSHISETTVPTALTMAETTGASGEELLTALILGDDLTTRIAAASSYMPGLDWDSPGIVNRFGAAAISGRLLGLTAVQIVDSFGIALSQLAGTFQGINDGAHTFKLVQGLAARDGIVAAELARAGWTGGHDPLSGKYGYFAVYCGPEIEADYLTSGLGHEFYGDDTFKPYPCCRFLHSTVDCGLELVRNHPIPVDEIDRVEVHVAPMHLDSPLSQPWTVGRFPQANANFSLRYVMASVLTRREIRLEHFTERYVTSAEIAALAPKVEVLGTLPVELVEGAKVFVHMRDRKVLAAETKAAHGNPLTSPLSDREIEDKYRANVEFAGVIPLSQAEEALAAMQNVERLDNVRELVALLTASQSDLRTTHASRNARIPIVRSTNENTRDTA